MAFFRSRRAGKGGFSGGLDADDINPESSTDSGSAAEAFARSYLRQQGLDIVATNYRTRRGEIDIVAREGDILAFIEVRFRSGGSFGGALASIDVRKQLRLVNAARQYLQENKLVDAAPCRFDALCLSRSRGTTWEVDWIRDAFRPEN